MRSIKIPTLAALMSGALLVSSGCASTTVQPTDESAATHSPAASEGEPYSGAASSLELSAAEVADASTNVFIGTVLTRIGNQKLGAVPEVQYKVQVDEAIKGKTPRTVTVNFHATATPETLATSRDFIENPLEAKSQYVFMTRYNGEAKWFTMSTENGAVKTASNPQILAQARNATPRSVPNLHREPLTVGEEALSTEPHGLATTSPTSAMTATPTTQPSR